MSPDATGLLFELWRILRASHRELIREEAPDAERAQALTAPRLAAWARGTVTQGHAYRVQRASIRSASIRGFTSELDRDLDMDHRDLDRVRGTMPTMKPDLLPLKISRRSPSGTRIHRRPPPRNWLLSWQYF